MGLPLPRNARNPRRAALIAAILLVAYAVFAGSLPWDDQEFTYGLNSMGPLPFSAMRGFTEDQLARHAGRLLLLGPALVLLATAGAAAWRARAPRPAPTEDARPLGLPPRAVAWGAGALSLAVTTYLILGVLRGRALIQDELTYRTQALLYADGRLAEDLPAWSEGYEAFTIATRLGLTGKYLFGEPLVQIPGALLGFPALAHVPLAAITLLAFHRALRGAAGAAVAGWSTALLALSPMFVFTNAIGLSHTTSLACVALAGLGLQLCREGRVHGGALIAGTALGFGLATRIQAVAPFGGVIGLLALATLARRRAWGAVGALVASGSVWVAAVGAYDHALTGSPLTLPWYLFEPVEHFGFGEVWTSGPPYVHTPGKALANLVVTAVRFNGWWLGWPASLGLLGVWAAVGRPTRGATPWLLAGLGLLAFNGFYYSPGVSDTGPVYYHELVLPACALGGAAIVEAARRWPEATAAGLAVHLVLGTGTFYAEHLARITRLVEAIHGRAEEVLADIEPPALLIAGPGLRVRKVGWVDGAFPSQARAPDDPVVVYTEMDEAWCLALVARHPDRTCWYLPGDETKVTPCVERWPALAGAAAGALPEGTPSTPPSAPPEDGGGVAGGSADPPAP